MASSRRPGIMSRFLTDWTACKVGQRVERVRGPAGTVRGGRFTCACCHGKTFRSTAP